MKKYLLLLPLLCFPAIIKAQTDTVANKISKLPYKHVDALAKFAQGNFNDYISKTLQYNHAVENSVKGQIVLLMSIGADGSVSHVTVLKSLSQVIDQEVVKVVNASPKWQPAMLNGQKISMDMVLNISIAIKGSKVTAPIPPPVAQVLKKDRPPVLLTKAFNKTLSPPAIKISPAVAKKMPQVIAKKAIPPVVKKPAPLIAKKVPPPVVKKPVPVIAKKIVPPVVKKPVPVIAKKVPPPVVKKPDPPKVIPPVVKKVIPPAIKKPVPPVAKKVVPPVIKKPAPAIAKAIPPVVKKPVPPVVKKVIPPVKKAEPIIAKNEKELVVKKPKRKIMRQDLFNPSSKGAVFPGGGLPAFFKYLGENIVYPIGSKKANIEGKVLLSFVVEEDGTINDVEIISSPADDLGQEAIRVLLASPKWKPAEQNGRKVPVSYQIPIKFTLSDKATN